MEKDLKKICMDIRCDTIMSIGHLGVGHIGGCLSVVELLGVLYFEAIGNKIQTYGKHYGDEPRFVLLDVYNVNNDSWWNYGAVDDTLPDCRSICAMANALAVECKREVKSGTIDSIIAYVKSKPMSMFAKEGDELPMEGVVAVPCLELKDGNGERIIVKIKGCDHCEDWANFMKAYK